MKNNKYIKVKDKDDLVRDTESNAILNCNTDKYEKYMEDYKKIYSEKQRINSLERDLSDVKSDINEIKTLLKSLAQNK